jgi:hypothetical protein
MRDDVLSYGFREAISSITLASMEDLGFYLANYSHADCMAWGRKQGCQYVTSRCGIGRHDNSVELSSTSPSGCMGDPYWSSVSDTYLAQKCVSGTRPCSTQTNAGYEAPFGTGAARCDAQCHYEAGVPQEGCSTPPSGELEGSELLNDFADILNSIDWEAWMIPLIWLFSFCMLLTCIKRWLCPMSENAKKYAYVLALFSCCVFGCGLGGAAYLYVNKPQFEAFVSMNSILAGAAICGLLLIFSFAMVLAVYYRLKTTLKVGYWLIVLVIVAEVACTFLIAYWIYSLGGVPTDALVAMLGDAHRHIDSFLARVLDTPIAVTEGIVCKMYQMCCRDPKLDLVAQEEVDETVSDVASGAEAGSGSGFGVAGWGSGGGSGVFNPVTMNHTTTCLAASDHQAATTDLELTLRDPSTPNFCAYTSGAPARFLLTPPLASCAVVETLDPSFSLQQCQDNFCSEGTDGYMSFLQIVVNLIQRYALHIAIGVAVLVLVQAVFAVNLKRVAQLAKRGKLGINAQRKKQQVQYRKNQPSYTDKV